MEKNNREIKDELNVKSAILAGEITKYMSSLGKGSWATQTKGKSKEQISEMMASRSRKKDK